MLNRRSLVKAMAASAASPLALGASLNSAPLHAQGFPSRTVTVITPYPAGGVTDYAARPLAHFLSERFGRTAIVENKPGAGGGIGHAQVARAEADGHTIMVTNPALAVIPEANRLQGRAATYEVTDFAPIARLFADPSLLWVRSDAKWRTIQDFIDDVRANPGTIPYGTSGVFGTSHLAMEIFLHPGKLQMLHVPYTGGAPVVSALLADQIKVVPTVLSNFKGLYEGGKVRPLVQLGDKRSAAFPDLPTAQEIGYKDVAYYLWTGVFAPAKTPQPVQEILRAAVRDFMAKPETVAHFRKGGTELGYLDGPEFAKFLEVDNARQVAAARQVKLVK